MPAEELTYGYVVGRFLLAVGDGPDEDSLPDIRPATGLRPTFRPLTPNITTTGQTAFIQKQPVECTVDDQGWLRRPPLPGTTEDPENPPPRGVWLVAGQYDVVLAGPGGPSSFRIAVTAAHTAEAPLDLVLAAPLVPTPAVRFVVNEAIIGHVDAQVAHIEQLLAGVEGGTGGPVTAQSILDSTDVGVALMTAPHVQSARDTLEIPDEASVSWDEITGRPSAFAPSAHQHAWTEVTGKPATYPPAIGATASTAVAGNDPRLTNARTPTAHPHAIGDVTGLQAALDAKADAGAGGEPTVNIDWDDIDGRPSTFPPAAHGHQLVDVDGLAAALAGKAGVDDPRLSDARTPVAHQHPWAEVTGKPATYPPTIGATASTAVAGNDSRLTNARTPTAHQHPWSEVTDKPATYLPAAHGHQLVDVDGLAAALAGKAGVDDPRLSDARTPTAHEHPWAEVTGKPATFPPTIGATASTAVAGNDSRLTNARTPTAHAHPVAEVTGLQSALDGKVGVDDARLSDARTPTAHSHPVAQLSDATPTTRTFLQATNQANARSAIGAGTSSLALGTTGSTAAAGNHGHADLTPRADTQTVVVHGGAAGTARPSGYASVLWIGTVAPTSGDPTRDMWLDTSGA